MNPEFTPFPPTTVCRCGKVGHPSRRIAVENLNRHKRKLKEHGKDKLGKLHVYYCIHGRCWHTGNVGEDFTKKMKG